MSIVLGTIMCSVLYRVFRILSYLHNFEYLLDSTKVR